MRYILAALIPCAAHAQSTLAPCSGKFADTYFAGVNSITDRAVTQPFQLQLATLPSFQRESVLRLVGTEIYFVQFRKFYWAETNSLDRSGATRKDFSKTKIPVRVRHAPLSADLAQRVLWAYLNAIAGAKNAEQMGVDGVSYVFTTPEKACALAWSPAPDSYNGRLIGLLKLLESMPLTAPAQTCKGASCRSPACLKSCRPKTSQPPSRLDLPRLRFRTPSRKRWRLNQSQIFLTAPSPAFTAAAPLSSGA
jgi:hypothetical protein